MAALGFSRHATIASRLSTSHLIFQKISRLEHNCHAIAPVYAAGKCVLPMNPYASMRHLSGFGLFASSLLSLSLRRKCLLFLTWLVSRGVVVGSTSA